jgi:peptide deformylase
MFNAKIVFHHGEDIEMVEGCLSIPGLAVKITRPAKVRVRFTDEEGKTSTLEFSGISARVIQHEMCHMRGEPFFRGLSKLKLERAIKHTEKTTGKVYRYSDLYKLMNG